MKRKIYFIGKDPDLTAIKKLKGGSYPEQLLR